jgi:hypothetical protein
VPAISADAPCGVDLEETQLLASFEAFQVFGNDTPLRSEIEWREIRDQTLVAEQISEGSLRIRDRRRNDRHYEEVGSVIRATLPSRSGLMAR